MTRFAPPAAPEAPAPGAAGAPDADEAPDPLLSLARHAGAGDREALARLLSLVGPSIVAAVRVVAGQDETDVEDAAQEAMIAIADSVARFRGESTFLHYARRIAVRTAFAIRRRRADRARKLAEVAASGPSPASPALGIGVDFARAQRLEIFRRLLDELPEGQAESLTYRVLLDYPLPVIARETGVPINTVRSRIRLARDHLRARILGDPELSQLFEEST